MSNRPGTDFENTLAISVITGGFFGISLYNSVEIFLMAFDTFRRWNTPYFWTIIIANVGLVMEELCSIRVWTHRAEMPMGVLMSISWLVMTVGQSFVLYLRLHLVVYNRCKLRWVLAFIIFGIVIFQIPTVILYAGLISQPGDRPNHFKPVYDILRIARLVEYLIQDCVIMGLYVYAFRDTSKPLRVARRVKYKRMLHELVALLVFTILSDLSVILNGLLGDYRIQTTLRPAIFSVRLKAELFILNNLVAWTQTPANTFDLSPSVQHPQRPDPLCQLESGHTSSSESRSLTRPHSQV